MTQPISQTGEEFSHSKFCMWRCIVGMAHADGLVHEKEAEYLKTIFHNMKERTGLPQDKYDILMGDLQTEPDIGALLPQINDPGYRAQLVYFARLLAYKDGDLHPDEQKLLDKLHAAVMEGVDFDAIKQEVENNVQQELVIHEVKKDSIRPTEGLYGLIDQWALHFGIDLMDE